VGCREPVGKKGDKLKELIEQLEDSYNDGCTGSGSDVEKLNKLIEKLDSLDEKLITVFHHIFFGRFEITKRYHDDFVSILNEDPEKINDVINEIHSDYKYGNHRKYCKKSFDYYKEALNSFKKVLPQIKGELENGKSFDNLFNYLKKVNSFGRTASWDFLEVIDRIISDEPLNPENIYLRNATGPKYGVHYFFEVDDNNELREKLSDEFKSLQYNYEILEKAGLEIFDIIKESSIKDEIKNDDFLIYNVEDALCCFQKNEST